MSQTSPTIADCCRDSARADSFGEKSSSRATRSTCSRVVVLTVAGRLNTRDTVATETPQSWAISRAVTMLTSCAVTGYIPST